jgi:hypothetical protein
MLFFCGDINAAICQKFFAGPEITGSHHPAAKTGTPEIPDSGAFSGAEECPFRTARALGTIRSRSRRYPIAS